MWHAEELNSEWPPNDDRPWISRLFEVHFFGFAQFIEGSDRVG